MTALSKLFQRRVTPSVPAVIPGAWAIQYSPGMPQYMPQEADGTHYFFFPQQDGVHYVVTAGPLRARVALQLLYHIDGDAKFYSVDDPPQTQAKIRLFLQRRGDSMTWQHPSHRFWSAPLDLSPGEHQLLVPLTHDKWTNVAGQHDEANFRTALEDIANMGFTFGGTFAGHGAFSTAPAKFNLLSFKEM